MSLRTEAATKQQGHSILCGESEARVPRII